MSASDPSSPRLVHTRSGVDRRRAEVLPASVSDAVVDEVVGEIHHLSRASVLDLARAVGRIILQRFYGGNVDAWRRFGARDASFRQLAKRADAGDLAISASGLSRAVALVELEERLGVSTWKHLSMSHIRLVFGLANGIQRELLTKADENGWTVPMMEKAAKKARRRGAAGRRPDPAFVKGIRRIGKLLDDGDRWFGDFEAVEDLDQEEALKLWQTVTGMKAKCEEMQKKLAPRVPVMG